MWSFFIRVFNFLNFFGLSKKKKKERIVISFLQKKKAFNYLPKND